MKNAAKREFSCKDRCRYSRKRAKICRKFAKNWLMATSLRTTAEDPGAVATHPRLASPGPGLARGSNASPSRASHPPTRCQGCKPGKIDKICRIFFSTFWQARSRLYQNQILQENMRLTTFSGLHSLVIRANGFNPLELYTDKFSAN